MKKYFKLPISNIFNWLKDKNNFVLLETNKFDQQNRYSYIFTDPLDLISTSDPKDVNSTVEELERYSKNFYLAGYLSYELGYFLEDHFDASFLPKYPLLWFGVFKEPLIFDHLSNQFLPSSLPKDFKFTDPLTNNQVPGAKYQAPEINKGHQLEDVRLLISEKEYKNNINTIKDYIKSGDTYQVNYTTKYLFNFSGSPYSLYCDLRDKQEVSYSAVIKKDDHFILSFSPELFFEKKGNKIRVKPMKGTVRRGRTVEEDGQNSRWLAQDLKNQSENIMIVDLLRNDLGRMSKTGTVKLSNKYHIEKYNTLFQMTSEIKSTLNLNISIRDLLKNLFPSGSITGAPKIKTMEIIRKLEREERGLYTGSIGFFGPKQRAIFNIAIRTLYLQGNKGEMGVGSGIVYDSDPGNEFEESCLKADFLLKSYPPFYLLETISWARGSFKRLRRHLARLKKSASYFNFPCDEKMIMAKLNGLEKNLSPQKIYKVRLLLTREGSISLEKHEITPKTTEKKIITLSEVSTLSDDVFLFHKTTNRALYNSEHARYQAEGFFDVIFKNERGEITEGAISNIFIKKGGYRYTPPISCGLLNGVYRQYLLENKKNIHEKVLYEEDIYGAEAIYLTNSIRGMVEVEL
ncbi:MAG: aminodeoxychorismate synthase component I [bacterium]